MNSHSVIQYFLTSSAMTSHEQPSLYLCSFIKPSFHYDFRHPQSQAQHIEGRKQQLQPNANDQSPACASGDWSPELWFPRNVQNIRFVKKGKQTKKQSWVKDSATTYGPFPWEVMATKSESRWKGDHNSLGQRKCCNGKNIDKTNEANNSILMNWKWKKPVQALRSRNPQKIFTLRHGYSQTWKLS